jgi:hypothetical protein
VKDVFEDNNSKLRYEFYLHVRRALHNRIRNTPEAREFEKNAARRRIRP